MMIRLRKSLWMAALAVVFGTAASARASIELDITSGVTTKTVSSPFSSGPVAFSGAVGSFTVTISVADSNSPGGQNALAEDGTFKITNNSSSQQTITITVSATNFTSPVSPPPLQVLDTISGSVATGSLISGTAQGFADASNKLFGTSFASTKLSFGPKSNGTSFSADGGVSGFTTGATPYSLTFTETFTLAGNSSVTLTGGNVQTAVPAPAGLVLALTGFPLLGFAGLLRRRRKLA